MSSSVFLKRDYSNTTCISFNVGMAFFFYVAHLEKLVGKTADKPNLTKQPSLDLLLETVILRVIVDEGDAQVMYQANNPYGKERS